MVDNIYNAVEEVLFDEETIAKRIHEIGAQITEDYKNDEDDIVLIGILKGAVVFLTDLVKCIDLPIQLDFMSVSSYGNNTVSTGDVRILKDLDYNITGKNIIIVEDIVDSGYTLTYLKKNLESRGAKSVRIATLLDKVERRVVDVKVDYIGFEIPDAFVIGFGLDYAEMYRNLPYVAILKPEIYM